jgi:hypothetical protein
MKHPLLFAGVLLTAACGGTDPKHLPVTTQNGVQCNPVSLGHCLLPIPSSFWQRADASSATGYRLALPAGLLPAKSGKQNTPVYLDPAPYNAADGWSPATSIFVHADRALDPASLPPHEDIAKCLTAKSSTVLLDAATGARVAHWAELDQNDQPESRRGAQAPYVDHGLLIRPASTLLRGHRYIVALTRDLTASDGTALAVPAAFAALRDGVKTDNELVERQRGRYASLFATLARAGLPKRKLLIAWDFDTASDAYLHRDILAMRAQALKALGETGIGYKITSIAAPGPNADDVWEIKGTYTSPLFLEDGGDPYVKIDKCRNEVFGDCPAAGYVRGADGLPTQAGTWERPFILTLPRSITTSTAPLKLVQFGHGLLGGGGEITSGYNRGLAGEWNIAQIAGDWTGLSADDVPVVSAGLINWNLIPTTFYRLGQGLIDGIALSYTTRRIAQDAQLRAAVGLAHDPFTADGLTYYGISLGGIMGGGFMALHPFIRYGTLNVAGAAWSVMIQRSSNWNTYGAGLATGYPSYLDAQILVVLSQTLWDISDPIAYAPHLIADPLPGSQAKYILYQEAVNDSQVPNVASEKMVRAMGMKRVAPSVREPFGIEPMEQGTSGFSIWDETARFTQDPAVRDACPGAGPVPPRTNLPPPCDNHTHGSIRKLPALKAQIKRFLWGDHQIVNTCDGGCDPE